ESYLSEKIKAIENDLPPEISIAYLPFYNTVKVRFTAKGNNQDLLASKLAEIKTQFYQLAGEHIVQEGDKKIEEVVGTLLKEKGYTIATAESCTGGLVAQLLTSIPGSSAYFTGSIVSYSNQVKIEQLGVSENTIKQEGAVSKDTVTQMAQGIVKKLKTDCAIATSGIA